MTAGSLLLWLIFKYSSIHKNVEPVLLPVPQCKGSRIALFVETSNVESPTPMFIYIIYPSLFYITFMTRYSSSNIKHPKGRSRCFAFDEQFELARFLHCQNQSVQKTPICIKSHPSVPPKGHRRGETMQVYKFYFRINLLHTSFLTWT